MKFLFGLLLVVVHIIIAENSYTISTIAGNGTKGFSGDNGPATECSFDYPFGVSISPRGDIFIASYADNRIRRIDISSNIITTIAGTGVTGTDLTINDGGPATSATLKTPYTLNFDSNGDMYIADTGLHRIRFVNMTTNVISTIAGTGSPEYSGDGGPATSAKLHSPGGVAVDSVGNVYIAEIGNHRVRKIDHATKIITTFAGNGTGGFSGDGGPATSAMLYAPYGIDLHNNQLYIADYGNNRVRKVDIGSGEISTIAGTGIKGYSGDNGPATSAKLSGCSDVAVDANGNVYMTQVLAHCVRRINVTTGDISTLAGNGTAGYSGDGGVAVTSQLNTPYGLEVTDSGDVYIADTFNRLIRKLSRSNPTTHPTNAPTTHPTNAPSTQPTNAPSTQPSEISKPREEVFNLRKRLQRMLRYVKCSDCSQDLSTPGVFKELLSRYNEDGKLSRLENLFRCLPLKSQIEVMLDLMEDYHNMPTVQLLYSRLYA